MIPPDSFADDLEFVVGGVAEPTANQPQADKGQSENLTEMETAGYSLSEILTLDKFRRRIARDYQRFLTTFTDESGHSVYHARIKAMCAANFESLEVSYAHLVEANAFLAKLVLNVPSATLEIFDEATMRIVLRLFEDYDRIRSEIHVRITDLPTSDQLRDLRYNHLNTLVKVSGVVTRRSGVFPQLKLVKYDCGRCGAILGPFVQDLQEEIKINACSECQARGPFSVNAAQTVYRNYQKVTLQEAPGSVPAGRLPRHKEVVLLWDLIDSCRPGEMIVSKHSRVATLLPLSFCRKLPVFIEIIFLIL
jgi:DNA replication licensing factor MCM2